MPLLHTSHIALGLAYPSRKFLFSYVHFSLKSVSHEWNDIIHTVLQITGFAVFCSGIFKVPQIIDMGRNDVRTLDFINYPKFSGLR